MPDNQTVNNDAEKHISPYGFGLLGEIVSDSEPAETCMRSAYERLDDVWDIYTKTIDGFMYMRAKREAYLDALEALSKGRTISIDIPQNKEKTEYRYE